MTKLLEQAIEAVRRLPADSQDEIARAILHLTGSEVEVEPVDPAHLAAERQEGIGLLLPADHGTIAGLRLEECATHREVLLLGVRLLQEKVIGSAMCTITRR